MASPPSSGANGARQLSRSGGIHQIRHVIVIMEENRSFDSFFGTYPGADGIPLKQACRPSARRTVSAPA